MQVGAPGSRAHGLDRGGQGMAGRAGLQVTEQVESVLPQGPCFGQAPGAPVPSWGQAFGGPVSNADTQASLRLGGRPNLAFSVR